MACCYPLRSQLLLLLLSPTKSNGFIGVSSSANPRRAPATGTATTISGRRRRGSRRGGGGVCGVLPVDTAWAPAIDSESIAPELFAASLIPYLVFLYFIAKSRTAPKLTLFGFYFLLAFVGATIPAGIYAKVHYGTSLSNVDWLHGGAESLLTLTNLFIVLGLREALRRIKDAKKGTPEAIPEVKEKQSSA